MTSFVLRARYVFPVAGRPIPDGAVGIEGERIVSVGPAAAEDRNVVDLGNAAILPGLVNAHAHLDFSDLVAPLGRRGIPLADWIRCVMEFRRRPEHVGSRAVAMGLDESLRAGVTALGDIVQPDWSPDDAAGRPIHLVAFRELIATTAQRAAELVNFSGSHALRGNPPDPTLRVESDDAERRQPDVPTRSVGTRKTRSVGTRKIRSVGTRGLLQEAICLHAPYSVHVALLSAVVEFSREREFPVAMHLAESREGIGTFTARRRAAAVAAQGIGGMGRDGHSTRNTAARLFAPLGFRPSRAGDSRQLFGR